MKGELFIFKVTKTRGRLENPSALLASAASGRGGPRTPFDRLGHLDQCQRVLGEADTLLSRGEKGHFWLLFRHLISRRNTSICCQVHFSNWLKLISNLQRARAVRAPWGCSDAPSGFEISAKICFSDVNNYFDANQREEREKKIGL